MQRIMKLPWKAKIPLLLVLIFLVIQIIPTTAGDNPPVTYTIDWDSVRTEELVRSTCFDCHSNEVVYPWYAYVAPVSWLVTKDVNEGRDELNFSTGDDLDVDDMVEEVRDGEMPLPIYLITHPEADLSDSEQAELIEGLLATFDSTASGDDDD